MRVGYARVSTHEQNLGLQTDALKRAGCEEVFADKVSGAKSKRPGLEAALGYVRRGDTLMIWRLDRLARSLNDLIAIIGGLETGYMGAQGERRLIGGNVLLEVAGQRDLLIGGSGCRDQCPMFEHKRIVRRLAPARDDCQEAQDGYRLRPRGGGEIEEDHYC